jgi:predicted transcriptional regulator
MSRPKAPQRDVFSTRVNPESIQKLKHLAVDLKRPLYSILEEAIELILKKHKKK